MGITCNDTKEIKNSQKNKNITSSNNNILKKDNLGNSQETDKNDNKKHIPLSKKPPFLLCKFASALDLYKALFSLTFIEFNEGELNEHIISINPRIVGENKSNGEYEVIIFDHELTKEKLEDLEDAFKEYGGKIDNFHKQEIKVKNEENSGKDDEFSKVNLVMMHCQGDYFYECNTAKNKEDAMAFLTKKEVLEDFNYYIICTPEGFFGKDITGIYSD